MNQMKKLVGWRPNLMSSNISFPETTHVLRLCFWEQVNEHQVHCQELEYKTDGLSGF